MSHYKMTCNLSFIMFMFDNAGGTVRMSNAEE